MTILFTTKVNQRTAPFPTISNEMHSVPTSAPFVIKLIEIPKQDSPSSISIPGFTETKSITPAAGYFYVNYFTGYITFNSINQGTTVFVTYVGIGSIIDAVDIDTVQNVLTTFANDLTSNLGFTLNPDGSVSGILAINPLVAPNVSTNPPFPAIGQLWFNTVTDKFTGFDGTSNVVFNISTTGVTPGSYGSATNVGQFTVNSFGQLTAASNVPVAIDASAIVSGILPGVRGGTNSSSFTAGSVIFAGSGGTSLTQDNANFFWDTVNHRLQIGSTTRNDKLDVHGSNTAASTNQITMEGYQAAFQVLNAAASQNWYFGVNDADSNRLYIGRGYSAGQGVTPAIAIDTSNNIALTNPLAISSGGTGQTSASAAFNALSPITSTGDLIVGNGSNSATRLGIGSNGQVLTSNGTTASWQTSSITAANALNSATTVVNVSSSPAPSKGQALIATSSTAATWQNIFMETQPVITQIYTGVTPTTVLSYTGSGVITAISFLQQSESTGEGSTLTLTIDGGTPVTIGSGAVGASNYAGLTAGLIWEPVSTVQSAAQFLIQIFFKSSILVQMNTGAGDQGTCFLTYAHT